MHSTANLTIGALMTLGAALTASSAVSTSPPGTSDPISLTDVDGISISGIERATVAIGSPAELTISGHRRRRASRARIPPIVQ